MGLRNQKSSTLLQQQQHCGHLEPFHRAETVIDRGDGGIGGQLAGDREFVIGQALDQFLSRRHRFRPAELEHDPVARAREGDRGSGGLLVAEHGAEPAGQRGAHPVRGVAARAKGSGKRLDLDIVQVGKGVGEGGRAGSQSASCHLLQLRIGAVGVTLHPGAGAQLCVAARRAAHAQIEHEAQVKGSEPRIRWSRS